MVKSRFRFPRLKVGVCLLFAAAGALPATGAALSAPGGSESAASCPGPAPSPPPSETRLLEKGAAIPAPLSLSAAIEIALANNPEIAARGWETAAARARQDQAFGERLPRFAAGGEYFSYLNQQRLIPTAGSDDSGLFTRNVAAGDLVLTLPLFTGGRLVNRVKAADLLRDAAAHRLARSREELVFNVSSVFFSILAQEHVIESLQFSRRALEEHIKRIEALIADEKAARVDLMRIEVRLADLDQEAVKETNLLSIQRRVLANLLGLADHTADIGLRGELELPEKAIVPTFTEALEAARQNRGDYLAARSDLEARARNVDAARAKHWPTLSLAGAYGGRWAAGKTTGSGDEFGDVGRVGLVLELPLFEGGRIEAGVREKLAELAAAGERLRGLELQIQLEIETARSNISSSEERLEAIGKSIREAGESLRIEQEKYDLGKGAVVDVLDSQQALLETETNYYRVLAELKTARAQLKLAMGEE